MTSEDIQYRLFASIEMLRKMGFKQEDLGWRCDSGGIPETILYVEQKLIVLKHNDAPAIDIQSSEWKTSLEITYEYWFHQMTEKEKETIYRKHIPSSFSDAFTRMLIANGIMIPRHIN